MAESSPAAGRVAAPDEARRQDRQGRWDWQQFRLANGLRLIVSPDHLAPIAAVNLHYDVGSRHEPAGQHGYAHLFEHLMFEGSAHVAKGEHFAALTAVGAANINATTDFERTNYFETVPVEQLELALWLEADRMGALELTQHTLDNQRDVVANERRQRHDNQPYGQWVEELLQLVFPAGHPYRHPVIGAPRDLDAAVLGDLQHFHDTYYAPNNAVLSVAGDVEPERVRDLVEHYFGGIGARDVPPPQDGRLPIRFAAADRKEIVGDVPMPRVYLAFRIPSAGSREHEVLAVGTYVFATGRGSRLYRELVRTRQVAQPNGGFLGAWELHDCPSLLVGSATARAGVDSHALEAAFRESLAEALRDGPSTEDLERARAQITSRWLAQVSTVAGRADSLSSYALRFDDPEKINYQLDRLLSVSADELMDVTREYIDLETCRVLSYEPEPSTTEAAA
jgi:predicted Zn-dependent peptidase